MQKHVDHKEFVDMNSQLKELRLDKKNLVIKEKFETMKMRSHQVVRAGELAIPGENR